MGINKIVLNTDEGDRVLVDLTGDTVTPETTFAGTTFHGADGEAKVGTFTIRPELDEQGALIEQLAESLEVSIGESTTESGGGNLPNGCREVAYLESTGTQYIDTGWNPGANAGRFTFDTETQNTANVNGHGAIGSRSVDAGRNWVIVNIHRMPSNDIVQQFGYGSVYHSLAIGNSNKWTISRTYIDGSNYVFETTCDGTTSSEIIPLQMFTNTANVYLFGINNKGSLFSNFPFIGKIRKAKLYDSGVLIKDFVPVLDWNDRPCMYDKVSGELFYNQGTGEFLYGDVVNTAYNAELRRNNEDLRSILDAANTLPDGVELPELENEGSAADLLNGKQLIDGEGNVVTGTLVPKADPVLQSKTVTPTKSVQTVVPDANYDGLAGVTVNSIPDEYIVPDGTKNVTANGTHDVTAYASVAVNVPIPDGYVKPSGSLSITQNGSYDVTEKAGVVVSVDTEPTLQEKTATPTKAKQTVTADNGYDGLSKVTVEAIPNQYITTTDANAAAGDIMKDKTAYVNGSKVTGSFSIDNELSAQDNLISQIQTALEGKAAGGSGGGSVETCTILLQLSNDAKMGSVAYTHLDEDGKIATTVLDTSGVSDDTIQIDQVVCGSLMYTMFSGSYAHANLSMNVHYDLEHWITPTTGGAVDTITFKNRGGYD